MPLIAEASRDASWSTSDFSSELLSKSIATMPIDSLDRKPFSASRRRIGLGPIDLNILEASPERAQRTRSIISRQKADYNLLYLQEGAGELEHCGNKIRVPAGSFVLLDNHRPYELLFATGSVCLAIHFEDHWLRKWVPFPQAIAAQAISGDFGWGAPLVAMLRVISDTGLEGAVLSRSAIADQLGALLALMVGKEFKAYAIGDIARASGFADPSHFARRFRQRYGTNPVQYRAPVKLAPADCRFPEF